MGTRLFITLIVLIVGFCCIVSIDNWIRHRRQAKKAGQPINNLELLKEQGLVTEEEFKSIQENAAHPQELTPESCFISSEEVMEIIEVALRTLNELGNSYAGDEKWAWNLGIRADLDMDLKELTLLGMKLVKPISSIDIIAEILAINIPVDLPEQVKSRKEVGIATPSYRSAARIIWVRTMERLSEPIAIQKEIRDQSRKIPRRMLLGNLMSITMKSLDVPVSAVGLAAIIVLMVAKIEFDAFSDEEADDS